MMAGKSVPSPGTPPHCHVRASIIACAIKGSHTAGVSGGGERIDHRFSGEKAFIRVDRRCGLDLCAQPALGVDLTQLTGTRAQPKAI